MPPITSNRPHARSEQKSLDCNIAAHMPVVPTIQESLTSSIKGLNPGFNTGAGD